ncbi:pre-mRNA-processing atp-dependent rna helicase prp5 [Anopheles sinensis]|uniref:Pre-mRNA-processing atp-dependent rna helicase prp5 n=1 Tax=Anopheles sinensis TaxID=74873 RepID=A0A084VIX7_ANOSI|nr:pre-mRNA-processing atp-dependent rna helicase prp5 [Anopheles sinensis]
MRFRKCGTKGLCERLWAGEATKTGPPSTFRVTLAHNHYCPSSDTAGFEAGASANVDRAERELNNFAPKRTLGEEKEEEEVEEEKGEEGEGKKKRPCYPKTTRARFPPTFADGVRLLFYFISPTLRFFPYFN